MSPRVWLGFTYNMYELAEAAERADVELFLPPQSQEVADYMGLKTLALPSFKDDPVAAAKELVELMDTHGIDTVWPLAHSANDLSYITDTRKIHPVTRHGTFGMINDKVTFARWLGGSRFRPEGIELVGAEKTIREVLARLENGGTVCIKPPRGVNGGLYWQISYDADLLGDPAARKIHPDEFVVALRNRETEHGLERWLVMEVLRGPELSIDVLCVKGDPRKWMIREKVGPSKQLVRSDHEVMAHVRHLVKTLGLHGLVSIQYMYDRHGNIKILEINLRSSGGCVTYGPAIFKKVGTSDLLTDWLLYMTGRLAPEDIRQWHGEVQFRIRATAIVE